MADETALIDSLNHNLLHLTMGDENILLTITYGKIGIWLGRHADRDEIKKLICDISAVDSGLTCEVEVLTEFSNIERMEGKGLILLSYRRKGDQYRAIFIVPLAKEAAVEYLLDVIDYELAVSDTEKTIPWEADDDKVRLLFHRLNSRRRAKSINISIR